MKIVVFGLSITSAWGNGHATLLRGLFRALHAKGHQVHFFERDTPYYASHRDAESFPFVHLHLYSEWDLILPQARDELSNSDVGMITSYCADGAAACRLVLDAQPPRTAFYDMDTPVTLSRLERGESVPYLPTAGLRDFDQVFSYTGGRTLELLRTKLQASNISTLYGWVDPDTYYRVEANPQYKSSMSYLGTFSADRQAALDRLLFDPAGQLQEKLFVVGGAMYPGIGSWPVNVKHFEHVAPPDHRAFYSSSPLTLNITRASMSAMGYCPSGRLFEAAACGTAVLSDWWEGLETFFEPGEEILVASSTEDVLSALKKEAVDVERLGARARQRTLDCHTAAIRAKTLIDRLESPTDERRQFENQFSLVEGQ